MARLEQLRVEYGEALYITSGYRCPDHNRSIGGAKGSQHVKGNAADIALPKESKDQERLLALAKPLFNAVVKGPGFVHVDLGPVRQWSYDEKI
jgi:uncharacterized protein YcbK (DUF882 family)